MCVFKDVGCLGFCVGSFGVLLVLCWELGSFSFGWLLM